jgi:putative transposase
LRRPAYSAARRRRNDEPEIQAIQAFVADSQQQGFDKLYPVVHAQGFGRHRLYRVYKALKLNMKRKGKRRPASRVKVPWAIPPKANDPW